MASAEPAKVSFTIRRPTPVSRVTSNGNDSDSSNFKVPSLPRHLTQDSSAPGSPLRSEDLDRYVDSSDEDDDDVKDELVTGFDRFGVQRLHEKKPQGPLVIPALKNKDWREMARIRRQGKGGGTYVPESAAAGTGTDGSVGGLGTRDTINSGPQLSGLQVRNRVKVESDMDVDLPTLAVAPGTDAVKQEETEDQRAIRALLAGSDGGSGPTLDAIPLRPTEDDAFQQDVEGLPEAATLDDYERVPVEQFGAALLRGMGWKEGQAASRKGRGPVEPWLPTARPALLGIGAKEKEVFDDGSSGRGKGGPRRPEKRYVPVIKKEAEDGDQGSGSRKSSRSPEPARRRDRGYDSGRDKERDRDGDRDRSRYQDKERERDRERERKDRRDYDRGDRREDYDMEGRRDRGRKREKERERDRSPRRDRSRRDYR